MERTSRQDGFWKGLSVVLLVVLVALVGLMWYQSRQPRYVYHEGGNPVSRTLASLTAPGGSQDIYWVSDLAEKSLPYVVNITTIAVKPSAEKKDAGAQDEATKEMMQQMQQMLPFGTPFQLPENHPPLPKDGKMGEGSGFIFREDGYVVTNAHVTDSGDSFKVRTNDGKEYEADLVGTDDFKDIAVLKIKGGGKFPAAVLGASTRTRIGEPVIAIGSPLGLKASVTAGIISTTERSLSDIDSYDRDIRKPQKYLQTDAAINRGNSGGPLINSHGEVIGINQAIVRWDGNAAWTGGGMVPIEGIGFAIPIDEVKNTIAQIVEHGKVVYPGISASIMAVKDFIEENENVKLKVEKGVYVQAVTVDGPAAKAGIQANDVILSINDKPVETGEELITEIGKYKVGDRVRMRIARQGGDRQEDVSVVLGALDLKNRPR